MGIGNTSVFRESDGFGFFFGGDSGQFPGDLIECVRETGSDSENKRCHGPN